MIASLFNFSGPDLLVILFVLLVFIGSKKLPEPCGLGRAVKEFNAARDEFAKELTQAASVPPTPVQPAEPKGQDAKK